MRFLGIVLATALLSMAPHSAMSQTVARDSAVARKTNELSVRARVADRRAKCMTAFGSAQFCDCLNSLPLDVTFQRYVTVATDTRSPATLPRNERRVAEAIIATRDLCVAKVFGQR